VKVIKERFVFSSNENQKLNVKAIWDSLIKNKYAMIAVLINFSINIFNGVRSAIGIYYYKYFFNDTNMMVIVGTLSLVPMLIGVFFSSVITKKLV
ncbi:MFS transporter, partial [Oenococcus oeni]